MLKLEVHTEAVAAEASKDRKLREQSEHYSKQLENELEGLKVAFAFSWVELSAPPQASEAGSLRALFGVQQT